MGSFAHLDPNGGKQLRPTSIKAEGAGGRATRRHEKARGFEPPRTPRFFAADSADGRRFRISPRMSHAKALRREERLFNRRSQREQRVLRQEAKASILCSLCWLMFNRNGHE